MNSGPDLPPLMWVCPFWFKWIQMLLLNGSRGFLQFTVWGGGGGGGGGGIPPLCPLALQLSPQFSPSLYTARNVPPTCFSLWLSPEPDLCNPSILNWVLLKLIKKYPKANKPIIESLLSNQVDFKGHMTLHFIYTLKLSLQTEAGDSFWSQLSASAGLGLRSWNSVPSHWTYLYLNIWDYRKRPFFICDVKDSVDKTFRL